MAETEKAGLTEAEMSIPEVGYTFVSPNSMLIVGFMRYHPLIIEVALTFFKICQKSSVREICSHGIILNT